LDVLLSSIHATACQKKSVPFLEKIDYAGISILITASALPITIYGFYCQPWVATIYATLSSIFGIGTFVLSMSNGFHSDKLRPYKGVLYFLMGVFAAVPALHLWFNELLFAGNTLPVHNSSQFYWGTGAAYGTGLFLYVKRIPEKYVPGKVNNCGHSHNFWHIATLIGLALTYFGVFENYYTRVAHACPAF